MNSKSSVTNQASDLTTAAKALHRTTLDIVWRQWGQLGSGAASRGRLQRMIDPEALVLASLALISEEPRLADVLHDFALLNSEFLSIQRMKNLRADYQDSFPLLITEGISWFARAALERGKDLRWRSLIKTSTAHADTNISDYPARWVEPSVRLNKVRGTRVRLSEPSALIFRLRLAFGAGIKADMMALLLATDTHWTTVRDIADATGYTVAAIRRSADDLSAAQLIQSREDAPAAYRTSSDPWRHALGIEERIPKWGSWRERFAFTAAFVAWSNKTTSRSLSPYAIGVQARELIERHRRAFERDLIVIWDEHTTVTDWQNFAVRVVGSLTNWMQHSA